jgi:hypothetical protein
MQPFGEIIHGLDIPIVVLEKGYHREKSNTYNRFSEPLDEPALKYGEWNEYNQN